MTAPDPASDPASDPGPARRPGVRRRVVIAGLALVAAVVLAAWLVRGDDGGPAADPPPLAAEDAADGPAPDGATPGAAPAEAQIDPGTAAPDFTLDTPEGTFTLADARGEIVVVNFWATWCGPCLFEMPEFQELHATRGAADGIRVVAVNLTSADSRAAAQQFARDLGLTFTIAFDDDGAVAAQYGVRSLPATFFLDRAGVVRERSYGPVLGERLTAALRAAGAEDRAE